MIAKKKDKWVVLDSAGKKVLGEHATKMKAMKQSPASKIQNLHFSFGSLNFKSPQ